MHIDSITADVARNDLSAIQGAFRALVNYPGEESIEGATPRRLTESLELVCGALEHDQSIMPRTTMDAIDGLRGGTYADGAEAIAVNGAWWVRHFAARCPGGR